MGKLRSELVPLIDPRRFSLASVESAYDALRDRNAQGKIIIDGPVQLDGPNTFSGGTTVNNATTLLVTSD